MTMNKIDTSGMTQSNLVDGYHQVQPNKDRPGSKEFSQHRAQPSFSDHAQISDDARRLVDLRQAVDVGRAAVERASEVRDERVAQVRERLESGFYQSTEVRERVAERISGLILEGGLF
jgi:hypothetical protein